MSPGGPDKINLTSYFTPENIIICKKDLKIDEIIWDLMKNLALTYGIGNVKQILNEYVRKNGGLTPVALNDAVLVQHFRLSTTDDIRIALAVIPEGVDYTFDEKQVKIHLLFLVISPKNRPDLFLRTLKTLRDLTGNKDMIDDVPKKADAKQIWQHLEQKDIEIPAYILAGDIMLVPRVVIKESNNLEDAIDLFVKTNRLSIPVIDKDGDLLGEVTIHELMRVCFPRYILWMDDITPVLNFEPFRNMLHNESNTWLDEIMTHDIAKIQEDEPAIRAGIEMTKLSVDHAYVLHDKKLVGIIPLQQFVFKALRE
ncbi:MAG: CBS domain-containing protein [Bacteroidales bacterium]|nr:CBS domain-containing protein [Bacteroidales bacterium]